jgi:hypothetical protein
MSAPVLEGLLRAIVHSDISDRLGSERGNGRGWRRYHRVERLVDLGTVSSAIEQQGAATHSIAEGVQAAASGTLGR